MTDTYIIIDGAGNPTGLRDPSTLPYHADGRPRFLTEARGEKPWFKAATVIKPVLGDNQHYEGPDYLDLDQETAQVVYTVVNDPPPPPSDVRVTDGSGTVTRAEMNALKEYLRSRL